MEIVQAVKKLNSISRERLNFRRRPFLCTTLYRNPMQASNFGGTFDQLFLWIFLWNFHRRCLSTSSIPWCKKVKMTKNSNQGGPALNRAVLVFHAKQIVISPTTSLSNNFVFFVKNKQIKIDKEGGEFRCLFLQFTCSAHTGEHFQYTARKDTFLFRVIFVVSFLSTQFQKCLLNNSMSTEFNPMKHSSFTRWVSQLSQGRHSRRTSYFCHNPIFALFSSGRNSDLVTVFFSHVVVVVAIAWLSLIGSWEPRTVQYYSLDWVV